MLRFLAFKQRTTPHLNGEVTYVSDDSIEDKISGQRYYTAHVMVPETEIARLGTLKLQPGMQTEVMINAGERTALRYLVQPLADGVNRAMREE